MWNTRKQRQLDALRSREEQATLTPKERQRLATLLRELEQDELASLRPALDAHEQEQRIEDLRLEPDRISAAGELPLGGLQREGTEPVAAARRRVIFL